jgi:hypothetical protein
MRKATFVRRPRRGRTRPPPTQGTLSTRGFNTFASAAIHRPTADVTSRRQHLRLASATVDAKFHPRSYLDDPCRAKLAGRPHVDP